MTTQSERDSKVNKSTESHTTTCSQQRRIGKACGMCELADATTHAELAEHVERAAEDLESGQTCAQWRSHSRAPRHVTLRSGVVEA